MNVSFDSSDDGDDRAELFTPIRGGRKSLMPDFSPTPSRSATTEESMTTPAPKANKKHKNSERKSAKTNDSIHQSTSFFADDTPNMLPKLHNSSWLGADMSPIQKGRNEKNILWNDIDADEDEDGDAAVVAPYRLGLTELSGSSVAASESFFLDANDDTDDLEESNNSKEQIPKSTANHFNNGSTTTTRKSRLGGTGTSSSGNFRPPIRPLFSPRNNTGTPDNGSGHQRQRNRRRRLLLNPFQRKFWTFWSALKSSPSDNDPSFVIWVTAFVLFMIGLHDGFFAYLAMRRGVTSASDQYYGLAWKLPWMGPTKRSLLRFGAFCPERLLNDSSSSSSTEYWRSLTSMVVPISLVEWLLLVWMWTRYLSSSLFSPATNFSWQLSWPVVYLLSSWTGQLWMMAFHYEILRSSSLTQQQSSDNLYDDSSFPALSGCAGWATAGVLCAVGIQVPNRRFPCFVSAILLVLLHQCQDTGSVIGCSAAAFFGWAYSGLWSHFFPKATASGSLNRKEQQQKELLRHDFTYYHDVLHEGGTAMDETRRWTLWHVLAAMVVFLLWFFPIVFLLYR